MDPGSQEDARRPAGSRSGEAAANASVTVSDADPAGTAPAPERVDPGAAEPETGAPEDQQATAVAALEDRLRRALADLDNLRKRHARELGRERAAEAERVAAAWLPVLDHLDLALDYAEAEPERIIQGVRAVRDQALSVLERLGFPRRDEVGVAFDPARHEVVNVEQQTDAEPGTVLRVLRPGYGEPERQLRPSAVTVAGGQG
ncbi:MAG TPA: nucleotide exchange factor GrpE [Pseudonocardiaceae bacterium]|jgi:molecular chaperone GrpE